MIKATVIASIAASLLAGSVVDVAAQGSGRIIVEKQTIPDGLSAQFEFASSWGAEFTLSDGQQDDSGLLVPRT
jgi:hypothetical protein